MARERPRWYIPTHSALPAPSALPTHSALPTLSGSAAGPASRADG
jgi:hypothetical protein